MNANAVRSALEGIDFSIALEYLGRPTLITGIDLPLTHSLKLATGVDDAHAVVSKPLPRWLAICNPNAALVGKCPSSEHGHDESDLAIQDLGATLPKLRWPSAAV